MEPLQLRAFTGEDALFLDRLDNDPDLLGPFQWTGFHGAGRRRNRWEQDGLISEESTALAVADRQSQVIGLVTWRPVNHGGPTHTLEVGAALAPEHRGQGLGVQTHLLLVDYVFTHTMTQRLEALTDSRNRAEVHTLQRAGFTEEGRLRSAVWQSGSLRDLIMFSRLRTDQPPPSPVRAQENVQG